MDNNKRGLQAKAYFGDFLQESRRSMDMSQYDLGYILGVSHATVWCWEKGVTFPKSIMLLKKLALVIKEMPTVVKNLVYLSGVSPTKDEWTKFKKWIRTGQGKMLGTMWLRRVSRDTRDTDYKKAFGEYLWSERMKRGITHQGMAKALHICSNAIRCWESGSAFPQDVMVLAYLDRLYGNLFDVLFGLCEEHGIHLNLDEKRIVLGRLSEFENTGIKDDGKSKPPTWEKYKPIVAKAQRRERRRLIMTDQRLKALRILAKRDWTTRRAFARAMWPRSTTWSSPCVHKTGRNGYITGPSFMDKLATLMWCRMKCCRLVVYRNGRCRLAPKGKRLMMAARKARKHSSDR